LFARPLEMMLELRGPIEVVLERRLAPARHHEHIVDPRAFCLFDDVLDRRLVDNRQHLLGLGLRRGEEPRS
jgi:hypothetical protein